MKDDYLWDKSGEPDPEIEHLERVMGGLRSRRDAQDLMPAFEKLSRKGARTFPRLLAIAAALLFAALALGTFAVLQRQAKQEVPKNSSLVMVNPGAPESTPAPVEPAASGAEDAKQPKPEQDKAVEVSVTKRSRLESRRRVSRSREALINRREQMEGLMAKEQLLKALQITSSNLDSVKKTVQGDVKQGPSS